MNAANESACLEDVIKKLNAKYGTPRMNDDERFYAIGACAAGIPSFDIFESISRDREIDADFDAVCHSAGIYGATEPWQRKLHRDLHGKDEAQIKKVLHDTHVERQAELHSSLNDNAAKPSGNR